MHPRLGSLKDPKDSRDFLYHKVLIPVATPAIVDHEPEMTPVKDQAQRGSCVGFAACAVKEFQEWNRPGPPIDLSEEFVYEQIRAPHGGANPRDAFKLLVNKGVCPEKAMPYLSTVTDSSEPTWKPTKHKAALIQAKQYRAQGYARITTLDEMMQSLVVNGPCLIGINWLEGWFKPKEKVAGYPVLRPKQGKVAGGHALCVCGYDRDQRRLKIKNSWGTSWGKSGYAWLSFEAVTQHLNDAWATFDLQSALVKAHSRRRRKAA